MMNGGDSGPALVPGKPADSRLIKAINYSDEIHMPPKGKLPADQIAEIGPVVKLKARAEKFGLHEVEDKVTGWIPKGGAL